MSLFSFLVLGLLILGSVAVALVRDLLGSVIIFMVYSLLMAILWEQLNAPDLASTEAALGAGITTVLFILTVRKVRG